LLITAFIVYFICRGLPGESFEEFGTTAQIGGQRGLLEFRNVLDVSYGAYVVSGACSRAGNLTEAPKHNEAVAIIRELLGGNTADVRLSAGEASTAISIIQRFTNFADTIALTLAKMHELAEKASSPDYSQVQVEEMQKEFEGLAAEINEIVDGTEYNFNKLFTAEGRSISIPIGNGSKIDIFARDFSFDAQGLELTADPESALSKTKEATENLNEYREYLRRQAARVEDATAIIESEIEGAMGVDLDDFRPELAIEAVSYWASQVSEDTGTLLDVQANVEPSRALHLLKDSS